MRRDLRGVFPEIVWDDTPRPGLWNVFIKLVTDVWYGVGFTTDHLMRVDLHLRYKSREETQSLFDALQGQRDVIERGVALSLTEIKNLSWEGLGNTNAARIATYRPGSIEDDEDYLKELGVFSVKALVALHGATAARVLEAIGR
jgi:hypothetical protein